MNDPALETLGGVIVYTVTWVPGHYMYRQANAGTDKPYYAIISDSDVTMGFAFTEDDAKRICMALDVVYNYVSGDNKANNGLLNALGKLRQ